MDSDKATGWARRSHPHQGRSLWSPSVQLGVIQAQRLLHHDGSELAAAAGLVGSVTDCMAKFVVNEVLAVIAKVAFKGTAPRTQRDSLRFTVDSPVMRYDTTFRC